MSKLITHKISKWFGCESWAQYLALLKKEKLLFD